MQDELLKLGDQILENTEGTKALALQLCREFEDKFLQHITGGEVSCFVSSGTCIIFYFPYEMKSRDVMPLNILCSFKRRTEIFLASR